MSEEKKDLKPGYRTTEFWLSLAAMIVGAVFASGAFGEDSQVLKVAGLAASVLGVLGYTVSRGKAKQGAKVLGMIILPLLILGCSNGMIRADSIDGLVRKVSDRHDALVIGKKDLNGDGTIDDKDAADRRTYLRSTELLRKLLDEAQGD